MGTVVRTGLTSAFVGLLLPVFVASCSPTGFAVNVAGALTEDRGFADKAKDAEIGLSIVDAVYETDSELYKAVGVQVWEGRVLLSGAVVSAENKDRVIAFAKGIPGVKMVIDEMQLVSKDTLGEFLGDALIEERLKARLLMADGIPSANYSVRVVKGVVYLLGVSHSQEELDRVLQEARTIGSVDRVVSHVRVRAPGT